jgi:glycosyltransferase involved in cell wall biosynthesis
MRILHAITRGDVGGAQTHVAQLAAHQAEAGDEVTILAGVDGPAVQTARQRGVAVRIAPALGAARDSGSLRSAYREVVTSLTACTPDIVHGHSSHAGLLARLAARRVRIPSVYTAHGWPFQAGAPWRQRLSSRLGELVGGRLGGAVICLTPAEAALAVRSRVVPRARVWTVPNGLEDVAAHLRREPGEPGDLVRMAMVARFARPKLQVELVERLASLADLPWELLLVGDGPERAACEVRAKELLGDRVRFLGHRDDVPALLAGCDVGVLWSAYEGMPLALLEEMRAGLCCVANDLPGVRFLFGDDGADVVVHREPATFELEMRTLLSDPDRIGRLAAAARDRYEAEFTIGTMAARVREVYESVLAGGRPISGRRR